MKKITTKANAKKFNLLPTAKASAKIPISKCLFERKKHPNEKKKKAHE